MYLEVKEHITNTPKQLMVYDALKLGIIQLWPYDNYCQMNDRKKLSKRDTNTIQFIEDYKNLGFFARSNA